MLTVERQEKGLKRLQVGLQNQSGSRLAVFMKYPGMYNICNYTCLFCFHEFMEVYQKNVAFNGHTDVLSGGRFSVHHLMVGEL